MKNNPSNEKAAWVFVPPQTAQENAQSDVTPDQKRLATIIAQMAIAGHTVHKLETGFLVSAIRPPTVPQGKARLRITFSTLHEAFHVEALLEALHKQMN